MADPGCGYTVQTDVQLWMRDRLVAVSYTHLDVYKRQALYRS